MTNIIKMIFPLFILLSFGCGEDEDEFIIDCLPTNLQTDLIAYYPFHGGALTDESSFTNDISNPTSAAPAVDRFGNAACAYRFTNSTLTQEFLTTGNSNFLNNLDVFSISLWYEPVDTSRAGGDYETLFSRGDSIRCPDRRGEWSLGLYDCRRAVFGHDRSVWANSITGFAAGCEGEVIAQTGNWQHVVAIRDADTYKIYLNGVLNDSETGGTVCSNMYTAQDIGDVFIGKYFTGKIDEILIYNRALSDTDIVELFQLESCCQ